MSCGIGRRHDSDPTLVWLWCGLAASAPIQPLEWETSIGHIGAALKRPKKKKERERERENPAIIHEDLSLIAGLSGLRIWRCRELQCKSQMRLGSHVAMAVV